MTKKDVGIKGHFLLTTFLITPCQSLGCYVEVPVWAFDGIFQNFNKITGFVYTHNDLPILSKKLYRYPFKSFSNFFLGGGAQIFISMRPIKIVDSAFSTGLRIFTAIYSFILPSWFYTQKKSKFDPHSEYECWGVPLKTLDFSSRKDFWGFS